MRVINACAILISASMGVAGAAWAQQQPAQQPRPAAPGFAAAPPAATAPASTCTNPNALGVARTVEIDTTGGPGFGFEHFKTHDFLRARRDRPHLRRWPMAQQHARPCSRRSPTHCTKATFFAIGKHATFASRTSSSRSRRRATPSARHTLSHVTCRRSRWHDAKAEIEKGFSAVRFALGSAAGAVLPLPGARAPAARSSPIWVSATSRIFSTDFDSFDFKMRKPEQVIGNRAGQAARSTARASP